ncbi:MAG: hypothetical protein BGO67_02305 [Alphaproteobacteria bacterium 41-28]|nr:MAG: hypothetical protein BGO67_02305 [Alphaproteobacteria bacterium 41-28]
MIKKKFILYSLFSLVFLASMARAMDVEHLKAGVAIKNSTGKNDYTFTTKDGEKYSKIRIRIDFRPAEPCFSSDPYCLGYAEKLINPAKDADRLRGKQFVPETIRFITFYTSVDCVDSSCEDSSFFLNPLELDLGWETPLSSAYIDFRGLKEVALSGVESCVIPDISVQIGWRQFVGTQVLKPQKLLHSKTNTKYSIRQLQSKGPSSPLESAHEPEQKSISVSLLNNTGMHNYRLESDPPLLLKVYGNFRVEVSLGKAEPLQYFTLGEEEALDLHPTPGRSFMEERIVTSSSTITQYLTAYVSADHFVDETDRGLRNTGQRKLVGIYEVDLKEAIEINDICVKFGLFEKPKHDSVVPPPDIVFQINKQDLDLPPTKLIWEGRQIGL